MKIKPVYFENQKQCAAALGLDESELKDWKAENCPAFKYGRIYHAPLLEWIAKHKPRALRKRVVATTLSSESAQTGDDADSSDEIVSALDWMHRRSVLFDVLDFLHDAYKDKRIDLAKYSKLGQATVEQLIMLGEVWEAGIDAPGFRKTWNECLRQAILQESLSARGSINQS